MTDAIEQYQQQAAFASRRQPAWHGLGTVFQDDVTTAEMLRLAYLDNWNVRLEPVETPYPYHRDLFWTVRDNPFTHNAEILGSVGDRYRVLQNEDLLAFGDHMLDGGRWETAGSIKQGTVVFASLALDHEMVLDPTGVADKINSFLLLSTSHDGSAAVQASVTTVRVVCANTLAVALKGSKQRFKIRHTETINGKVQAARDALGIANKYLDAFDKEAQALIAAEISTQDFWKIIEQAYPKPTNDSKAAVTRWQSKVELIEAIYGSVTTHALQGTKWGALNAMTERMDWFRQIRGGNVENAYAAASGFDVVTEQEKQRLFSLVKAY